MDSIREQIIAEVKVRLQQITTANGYKTNIGVVVTEGMLIDGDPPVYPSINFWDGDETAEAAYSMVHRRLQLTVEGYDKPSPSVADDDLTPDMLTAVARNMVVDVDRALWLDHVTGRSDPTLGGLAAGIAFVQSQPSISHRPVRWIGSTSLWEITYKTRAGNPYAQDDEED